MWLFPIPLLDARARQRTLAKATTALLPKPPRRERTRGGAVPALRGDGAAVPALRQRITTAAFAFCGYEMSSFGRSAELLDHPAFGPILHARLDEAAAIHADVIGEKADLVRRVRRASRCRWRPSRQDVATIVAIETAQIEILKTVFDVPVQEARLSFGHSIGELSTLVLGGVYRMDELLPVPLVLAPDCAELARDTAAAVLSFHGGLLDFDEVRKLCHTVSRRGLGLVGPSTYLAPNTVLLLGQGKTLDVLEQEMPDHLPSGCVLKRKADHWPPLHTPLVWERNIPNRSAMALYHTSGGQSRPLPPVVSCVTGAVSYDEFNSRDLLIDWSDHPQRLSDVIDYTLAAGVQLIIHVGPEPRLLPTTFDRLSSVVKKQLRKRHLSWLGQNLIPSLSRNGWLVRHLPRKAMLIRAPYVDHVILEDWLLAQKAP